MEKGNLVVHSQKISVSGWIESRISRTSPW